MVHILDTWMHCHAHNAFTIHTCYTLSVINSLQTQYTQSNHDRVYFDMHSNLAWRVITGILRHIWDLALALSRGLMKICEQISMPSFSSTWDIVSQLHVRNNTLLNVAMYRSLLCHLKHKSRASGHKSSYWQWCEVDKRKLIENALVAHLIITGQMYASSNLNNSVYIMVTIWASIH